MSSYEILTIERRTRQGAAPSLVPGVGVTGTADRHGWYAKVRSSDETLVWVPGSLAGRGIVLDLSRFDGEQDWTIDGVWFANGAPAWVNGYGSRCTLLVHPHADLADLLDDTATIAELTGAYPEPVELSETADYYSQQYHYRRYPAQVHGRAGAFCVWSRDVERPNPEHVTWSPETAVLVSREYQNEAWHAERAERARRPAVSIGDTVRLGDVVITVPRRATQYVDHVPCPVVTESSAR